MNWEKTLIEYDASDNPVYVGQAREPNKNENADGWYIKKITYDASNNPTVINKKIGIWANRATMGWG